MIFRAKSEGGHYRLGMVSRVETDEHGNETVVHDWYVVPLARTILLGKDGDYNYFRFVPHDEPEYKRLDGCAEFEAYNDAMFMARNLEGYRKCVTVSYGPADLDGGYQSMLLNDYILNGLDPAEINNATTAGDYLHIKT